MVPANAALASSYDYHEVARSAVIAVAGSYGGLDLAGRVPAAMGRARLAWLGGGATAMGIGIWTMHLKGMLAFHLPVPVEYHWPTLFVALLLAIFASSIALYMASRQRMDSLEALTSCVVMGGGIVGLHYLCMAAMRLPAITRFSPLLVAFSVLLAILFSLIALLIAFGRREEIRWSFPRKLGGATVMGVAVLAMHYTGMAAATFIPGPPPDLSHAVNISPVGSSGVVIATLILLVVAITTSSVDKRARAERTLQLETINRALRKEIAERERAEEAVRESEDRLRLVIDTIPQQIWSGPPDGSLDFCNAQWRSYMGLTQEDLQGEGWQSMLHRDDRQRVLNAWRESVANGTLYEQEERHRQFDGQYRWFLARGVSLRDSAGDIVRWYGTNTDIQDRKEAEDRLRLVVDTTPAMLHSARPDGYMDFFNKRWLEYVGLALDDLLGWRWTNVIHPDDLAALLHKWRASLASGRPFEAEARLRRADGEYRLTLHRKVSARDDQGDIVKWYGSCVDIEDRKRAEEALQKAQENLARVTRVVAMGELVAAIAHEVNQPLAAIVTNASFCIRHLLSASPTSEALREAISEIVNDGERASTVISRIRALLQKSPPERIAVDMNQIIQEVSTLLHGELTRNGVSFRTDLSADLPRVLGDRVLLQQVLINLVMNSIDAMRSATRTPRELLIKSAKNHNEVSIQVQDSGIGVDPQQTKYIFEPFFTTKSEGIGMGLSIARSIVESHGGRLSVESRAEGALFQFTLPPQ